MSARILEGLPEVILGGTLGKTSDAISERFLNKFLEELLKNSMVELL